jgi:hypothetical protein
MARPGAKGATNAVSTAAGGTNSLVARLGQTFKDLQSKPGFYRGAIAAVLVVVIIIIAVSRKLKAGKESAAADESLVTPGRAAKRKTSHAPIQSCNVVQVGAEGRQVWQFNARSGGFVLNREQAVGDGEVLPAGLVGKDWRCLWQRKVNIAWLPPEKVFLRAVQFPRSDYDETVSMVELQLEKLSPMPVAQIVWSIHLVPHATGNQQTVIVIIVARSVVEEFLGQLEQQGFMADRLEAPGLDELLATPIKEDGTWIYPSAGDGKSTALAAWWYGGVLHHLDLVHLAAGNRPAILKEQLMQTAWAGELEGWLTSQPRWHLVAGATAAAEWEPALRAAAGQPVEVIEPVQGPKLAALTASRVAHGESEISLLPQEFSDRYQQQFVDRLWMRGLFAVLGLYVVGVAIYFIALQFTKIQLHGVEEEVANLAPQYTNAISMKARLTVLKDRDELKFAALDCWKAVAELLPMDAVLDGFNFTDGKKLTLNGTAPADQGSQLIQFEKALRKYPKSGQPLFDPVKGESLNWRVNPGGSSATWTFSLELKRSEAQ